MVTLVIGLPDEHDPHVEQQANELLNNLRTDIGNNLQVAVAVAASPSKWAACTFDGYVKSKPLGSGADALAMFNMLAALMAPNYLCPFDAYDILGCVGSAAHPSSLHSITFFPDSGEVVPNSADAEAKLRACAAMAFAPVSHSIRVAQLARLLDALRNLARPGAHIIQMAGGGLVAEPFGSSALPVQVLTRLTLS